MRYTLDGNWYQKNEISYNKFGFLGQPEAVFWTNPATTFQFLPIEYSVKGDVKETTGWPKIDTRINFFFYDLWDPFQIVPQLISRININIQNNNSYNFYFELNTIFLY